MRVFRAVVAVVRARLLPEPERLTPQAREILEALELSRALSGDLACEFWPHGCVRTARMVGARQLCEVHEALEVGEAVEVGHA